MRDAGLRKSIRDEIRNAVISLEWETYNEERDASWEAHEAAGGDEYNWDEPWYDREAAHAKADKFAERCRYADTEGMIKVSQQLQKMGMDAIESMGNTYRSAAPLVTHHEEKLQELERRQREVKRDFDALQSARPVEGKVING